MKDNCSSSGKIKILQFPIANSYGGITHYALNNWEWMDKTRFQCDFATMSPRLDFAEQILATGSKIHYISCYAEENERTFVKEFQEVLDQGYDVVHLHTKQWKSFLIEELCREKKIAKVIVHAHSVGCDAIDEQKRKEEEALHERIKKQFTVDLATDFWACSKAAAGFLFGNQIPRDRIKIMPNAIELDKFTYDEEIRRIYRKRYRLDDCMVIGCVGRFAYEKNHKFLVEVFYSLLQKKQNVKLLLLGDGKLLGEVRNQVKKLGIQNKVLFLGKREDVNCWYQAMDVFCLPSMFEGLGIVMIEAQSAGLPCIGSLNMPPDVELTQRVKRLPFIVDMWVEQILGFQEEAERKSDLGKIAQAGYDLKDQIKIIEKNYQMGHRV